MCSVHCAPTDGGVTYQEVACRYNGKTYKKGLISFLLFDLCFIVKGDFNRLLSFKSTKKKQEL